MAPSSKRKYGPSTAPAPSSAKSPKSARKHRAKHPLELYHLIPSSDSSDGEEGAPDGTEGAPEPFAKRRKADPSPGSASMSPPSFNSSNFKSGKRALDYSPIEEHESSDDKRESSDDEPQTFNFSNKPRGKKGGAQMSSQYVYDDATDMSSGEETSIPGTMPHATAVRGNQKVPGREPSELPGSDDGDIGERSFHAVRSSQEGVTRPAQSGGSSDHESEYESAEDGSKHLPSEPGPAQVKAGAEDSSDASTSAQSSSSDSEAPAAGGEGSISGDNADDQSSNSGSNSAGGSQAGASERPDKSDPKPAEGPSGGRAVGRSGRSALAKSNGIPATKSNNTPAGKSNGTATGKGNDTLAGKSNGTPTTKTRASPKKKVPAESQSTFTPQRESLGTPSGLQGRLTTREEQLINGTIEKFLAMNQLSEEDLPALVKGGTDDTDTKLQDKFWHDIYDSLPHRTSRYLRAIVKRKHTSYSKHKKWSTEEDKRLVELAKEHDQEEKKWLHVGEILGRTAAECRDRHRNYALCGSARTIGLWQPDELRLLLQAVGKSVPEDAGAGDRPYDVQYYNVDWIEVSAAMGGRRSRQQCLAKWTKMRVNVNNVRVRQVLHGYEEASPELRIVLMQVYSTPEEGLRMLVGAIATHVSDGDREISWRDLKEGQLTKDMRIETLSIIWARLRKGLAKGLRNKSDQECARRMYDIVDEQDLEKVVADQEDIETEEAIMSDPPRHLSTRASFMVGRRG